MKIYLASKSPRRQELLKMMQVDFELKSFDLAEELIEGESPQDYSLRICREKLEHAWQQIQKLPLRPILCADTEVVVDEKIYGKPRDYQDAFAMLSSYSGRSHQVITSVGMQFLDEVSIRTNITQVFFADLSPDDIHRYLSQDQFMDKAGAYGIQSYIAQFIDKIHGCYYSVMGLPLNDTRLLLEEFQFKLNYL